MPFPPDLKPHLFYMADYEVDFSNIYNRLAALGAKFNEDAYLRDEVVYTPKKL